MSKRKQPRPDSRSQPSPSGLGSEPAVHPYRALMNFAIRSYEEETLRASVLSRMRWQGPDEWGPHLCERENILSKRVADALRADCPGFPVEEIERRVRNLERHCLGVLRWQRDVRPLSQEELQRMDDSDTWHNPVSDYLREHSTRMMEAWKEVEALTCRVETALVPTKVVKRKGPRKIDKDAMEDRAKRYLYTHRRRPNPVTNRELAEELGCSEGYANNLDAWREEMEKRGDRNTGGRPGAVNFTAGMEATLPDEEAERQAALQRLIIEQEADAEPSPCDDDPPNGQAQRPRSYKRA